MYDSEYLLRILYATRAHLPIFFFFFQKIIDESILQYNKTYLIIKYFQFLFDIALFLLA